MARQKDFASDVAHFDSIAFRGRVETPLQGENDKWEDRTVEVASARHQSERHRVAGDRRRRICRARSRRRRLAGSTHWPDVFWLLFRDFGFKNDVTRFSESTVTVFRFSPKNQRQRPNAFREFSGDLRGEPTAPV